MLYSQQIKNLVSGISQQPAVLRHPEQLEEQVNAMSTEVGGLQKRPPTIHVAKLFNTIRTIKPLVHVVRRDENEKYSVLFDGNDVKVYSLDGTAQTVNYEGSSKDYILTSDPRKTLKCVSIADYTFVTNTLKAVRMSNHLSAEVWDTQGALVNIKSGQYGRTYKVLINGAVIASFTTPDGSQATHTAQIATDYIVGQLAAAATTSGYTVVSGSSWLYISKYTSGTVSKTVTVSPSTTPAHQVDRFQALGATTAWENNMPTFKLFKGTGFNASVLTEITRCEADHWTVDKVTYADYYLFTWTETSTSTNVTANTNSITSVEVYDGYNNQAAYGILRTTQKFSYLPASAPDGFTVKVAGEADTKADDYYISYVAADKVWKETVCPDIPDTIEGSSMPHALIRQADGSFIFKAITWDNRAAGDEDSNALPSFIGQTINDVCFFRNRLGAVAGENILLSSSGEFFKFWLSTATDVIDTDTIDVAVSDNQIATLYNAVQFNEELLLFSRNAQFILSADGVLSPKNATPDKTTDYECSVSAHPVTAGKNAYFAAERAEYTSIMEYFVVDNSSAVKDAQNVTSHVPAYIPNGVHKLIPNTAENILLVLTEGAPSKIFVYKFLFIDGQRAQSSWSHWDFGDCEILGGGFDGSTIYLVINRNNQVYLEKLLFTYDTKDFEEEQYRVFMDRKILTPSIPSESYDAITGTTMINLSDYYDSVTNDKYGIVTAAGVFVSIDTPTSPVVLQGDYTGQHLIVGQLFNYHVKLSELMIKKTDDRGTISDTEGRLQLKNVWLNYSNSGYFKVTVEHTGKDTFTYEMTARIMGSGSNVLGSLPISTGEFKFPVQSHSRNCAIYIDCEYPNPVAIIGAGWEGNYTRRTQRV